MKSIVLLETKWYLAVQDGRLDNIEYDTFDEAEDALRNLSDKRGVYITNYKKQVDREEFFRNISLEENNEPKNKF